MYIRAAFSVHVSLILFCSFWSSRVEFSLWICLFLLVIQNVHLFFWTSFQMTKGKTMLSIIYKLTLGTQQESNLLLPTPPFFRPCSRESEDLSIKARSRFNNSLRGLSQLVSLGELARTWDACAHKVLVEYAQQTGGGTFSSTYGTWEKCVGVWCSICLRMLAGFS